MSRISKTLKRDLGRAVIIAGVSAAAGILYNSLHPAGLPPALLSLPVSGVSREQAWRPVSTDSAFFMYVARSAEFVDIRPAASFTVDHIPGAVSLPFIQLARGGAGSALAGARALIIYDFEPHSEKAVTAVRLLLRFGFSDVSFLRNGYAGWLEYGFPVSGGGR
ncbi:hypothetical protein JXO52_04955 [bacterium]|nr:hypothetical protein [bacterium]